MVLCYLEMLVEGTLLINCSGWIESYFTGHPQCAYVHCTILLTRCITAYIEFTCNAQSINDHFICVCSTVSVYKYTVCVNVCAVICLKHKLMYVYHCELRMPASLPPSSFLHCPSGKQTRAGLMLGPLTAHTFTL